MIFVWGLCLEVVSFGGGMQFVSCRDENCLFVNIRVKCRCRMVALGFEGKEGSKSDGLERKVRFLLMLAICNCLTA